MNNIFNNLKCPFFYYYYFFLTAYYVLLCNSFRFCTQPVSIVSLMRPAKSHIFLFSCPGNEMEAREWVALIQPRASQE